MAMHAWPEKVTVVEVAPRDGLQNEASALLTAEKLALIDDLVDAGIEALEVTGFMHPGRIPQLTDAEAVYTRVQRRENFRPIALVPNLHGLQRADAAGCTHIAVITAASDTFNRRNINCDTSESLRRLEILMTHASEREMSVRAYISCALGCPFEGEIPCMRVAEIAARLFDMGCNEIVLADTVGAGTPHSAQRLVERVTARVPVGQIALHFHNTRGQALANILACLSVGVTTFDSAVAGLGGCPYAPGAGGNLATEDLIYMLHGLGITTGIDLARVIAIGRAICTRLQRPNASAVGRAGLFERHEPVPEGAML